MIQFESPKGLLLSKFRNTTDLQGLSVGSHCDHGLYLAKSADHLIHLCDMLSYLREHLIELNQIQMKSHPEEIQQHIERIARA